MSDMEELARLLEATKAEARELRARAKRAEELLHQVSHDGTVGMPPELRRKIRELLAEQPT
ncbi:MAG: hypothetical protein ACYDDC_05840 [Thermoplasmataceae archaeon]